ncbi:peptidoglycan DD-metalloendopeptidase family protein [Halobacillus yeomjeoni]|uniref:M23 family metallopeptidase n=1 Tax=Halobacillus yeomjeoni TaxID=311194 RepID=A0A931HVA0_9BACI|nr:M23 family metallopeptidase [Halobacillus yeomjeoni]MBH0230013.1 M23 family metallopeptidase [Halobacillus yeomjeoni]
MKKDIRHVRKNIAERKRRKVQQPGSAQTPVFLPPQDEEMHGYPPLIQGMSKKLDHKTQVERTSRLGLQLVLSALLFATVAIGKNAPFSFLDKPEQWLTSQMEEEFPFAKVSAWYNERFGDPLQVVQPKDPEAKENLAMPVNGTVTTSFQNDGKGIVMSTAHNTQVKAVKEGIVIFAGKDGETKRTVILQHDDGSKSIYGFLSTIDVHLYEHVQAQADLGAVQSEEGKAAEFFFAIEKDKKYLDPVEVIKVDESS